jgi:phage host-nuclease inhibitor protein Gam
VQRILALESDLRASLHRVGQLQERVEALQREMTERVAAAHRQYKRELVPVRNATVVRLDSSRR